MEKYLVDPTEGNVGIRQLTSVGSATRELVMLGEEVWGAFNVPALPKSVQWTSYTAVCFRLGEVARMGVMIRCPRTFARIVYILWYLWIIIILFLFFWVVSNVATSALIFLPCLRR